MGERPEIIVAHDHEVTDRPAECLVNDVLGSKIELELVHVVWFDFGVVSIRAMQVEHTNTTNLTAIRRRI